MPPTKIQAFLEEFPWIRKHVSGEIVQAYVSGVELALLDYSLTHIVDDDDWTFISGSEKIFLLDEKGDVVTANMEWKRRKFFLFGPIITRTKVIQGVTSYAYDCVAAVVALLGEMCDSIRYVLSYYGYTQAVIIYKLPRGVTFTQWIVNQAELEIAEFRRKVESERENIRKEIVTAS